MSVLKNEEDRVLVEQTPQEAYNDITKQILTPHPPPPPNLLEIYNRKPTSYYDYDLAQTNDDERYATLEKMVKEIANRIRSSVSGPQAAEAEAEVKWWWTENNKIFIHAFRFGVIHSIQLLDSRDNIVEDIYYISFTTKYKNMDMFLTSFINNKNFINDSKNKNIIKIRVNMNLERIVHGSIFDPGEKFGGRKRYKVSKTKYRKHHSHIRSRNRRRIMKSKSNSKTKRRQKK